MTINVWDVLKDLSNTKARLITEENKNEYPSFLMNGAFSRFIDTVLDANQMNMNSHVDKLAQYDYYYNSVRRKKRYSGSWGKIITTPEEEAIALYHDYSLARAKEVVSIFEADYMDGAFGVVMEHYEKLKEINTS